MTSTFERHYKTDPAREAIVATESPSIELSDAEILRRNDLAAFIYGRTEKLSLNTEIELPSQLVYELENLLENVESGKTHAKSESKSVKRKPKKANPKRDKTAVESVQEKL